MANKLETNAADFHPTQDDVFGRIASRYDLMCDLFSLGIHRSWKNNVAREISQHQWQTLLDSASGTGDIVKRIAKRSLEMPGRRIIAADISPKMLSLAEVALRDFRDSIAFKRWDAENLAEVPDDSVDVYSMSLALKICDRTLALREAFRVLKPGGKLVVLEASNIKWNWLNQLYLIYMQICMPIVGWVATGGDSSAYQYLLQGIKGFPTAEELVQELGKLGFERVRFQRLTLGIVAIHSAYKPQTD